MSDHVGPSLKQRPNVILLAAGTNDMNPNRDVSKEGNDPEEAADRLGKLIDKMTKECPDATILVAMIINTCREQQSPATKEFQKLIPGVVESRNDAGRHVLAVDFTSFKTSDLQDCIHPSNDGYKIMGDYWYSFIHQIPDDWIKDPKGPDPDRLDESTNGGIDKDIPRPDWGTSPIQVTSKDAVAKAAAAAAGGKDGLAACGASPKWKSAGKVALGNIGHNGDWKYHSNWEEAGELARGVGKDKRYVRLHDMNGDGKAGKFWMPPPAYYMTCVNLTRAATARLRLDSPRNGADPVLDQQPARCLDPSGKQRWHHRGWRGSRKDNLYGGTLVQPQKMIDRQR